VKKIGLIGGIGPESTVDYYKKIISTFLSEHPEKGYPEIILYSASLSELMDIMTKKDWSNLIDWLTEKVSSLELAGADFAVICSNTPHVVFQQVSANSSIPMLSIVDEACKKALALGLKKPGLIGTKFTMESDFFQSPFSGKGMDVVVPGKEDQALIHDRLFSEIELGIIKDSTRQELLAIVKRMIDRDSIDSLILGCTELPLILDRDEFGIHFLNTTAIHVESIVNFCLDKND
jgi:aspartate racemase